MDKEIIFRDTETGEEFTYEKIEAEYERLKHDGETEAETIGDYIENNTAPNGTCEWIDDLVVNIILKLIEKIVLLVRIILHTTHPEIRKGYPSMMKSARTVFTFVFAFAGVAAAAANSEPTSTQDNAMNPYPEHFADFRTTGVNRELSHAPIYGTFYDEASA